jgi:hypothetical protein
MSQENTEGPLISESPHGELGVLNRQDRGGVDRLPGARLSVHWRQTLAGQVTDSYTTVAGDEPPQGGYFAAIRTQGGRRCTST